MRIGRIAMMIVGFVVAVIVLVAATQLLLIGFEADPLLSSSRLQDITDWMRDRPRVGAGLLIGLGLVIGAVTLGWTAWASRHSHSPVITTRRRQGWTKIDRASLADSVARRIDGVDRRTDIEVSVRRDGRVDLDLVTPDVSRTGSIQELRDLVDRVAAERGLPCRSGRVVATVPRRMTKRRKIR